METPSPNVRGRARQPNFVNEEIDCLLELISQNREVLLSNTHKAHNMRQKQLVWQEIADNVTLNCGRLCKRDGNTVRQKWKDLLVRKQGGTDNVTLSSGRLCKRDSNTVRIKWKDLLRAARQDMHAVEAARKSKSPLPTISPYSNRVMQIRTGTPIFENGDEDRRDFFSAISLLNNGHCETSRVAEDKMERLGDENRTGSESTSGWDQCEDTPERASHKTPKFSTVEIKCLLTLYDQHKTVLKTETATHIWESISRTISEKGTERTGEECQQKWLKFRTQAIKEEQMEEEEAKKGGSFPKSQFTNIILKVDRTEEGALDSIPDDFWDSVEDMDVTEENDRMSGFIEDEALADEIVVVKKEPMDDEDVEVPLKDANGEEQENGVDLPAANSSAEHATSVPSRPLRRTLASRPDLPRKRKRPLSSFINNSRFHLLPGSKTMQSRIPASNRVHLNQTRPHHNTNDSNSSVTTNNHAGINHQKNINHYHSERLSLENQQLQLAVEKQKMEIAIMRSQQEKIELEKEKIRLEMLNLEQVKEKMSLENELMAMKVAEMKQKFHFDN